MIKYEVKMEAFFYELLYNTLPFKNLGFSDIVKVGVLHLCQHTTKKSQYGSSNKDSKLKVQDKVLVLLPHGFQELNSITRNQIAMKVNFSPVKHPKVLWAILANSYSVKFAEEVQDFSRANRYLHTKSLERCKQRLNHSSSRFCSSNRIKVTFIFDSKLITTTSCNREGNKSINVKAKKQQITNGHQPIFVGPDNMVPQLGRW
jgi:hypothetical protein